MDSRGYLTVNASQVLGNKEFAFGLVTDCGYRLVALEGDGGTTFDINHIVTPTLLAAGGLKIGPAELEFGATIPFVVVAGERGPDSDGGTPTNPNDDLTFGMSGQGVGNIGLHLKTRFLKTSKGPKIGVGLIGSLYLGTFGGDSSPRGKFLGDGMLTRRVLLVVDKEFGRGRRFRAAINAGFRARTGATAYTDTGSGEAGSPDGGPVRCTGDFQCRSDNPCVTSSRCDPVGP